MEYYTNRQMTLAATCSEMLKARENVLRVQKCVDQNSPPSHSGLREGGGGGRGVFVLAVLGILVE